jgi:O-glycosyl hydrolase
MPVRTTAAAAVLVTTALALLPSPAAADAVPVTATVSTTPAQTIDGFGASGAWWVNDLANFSPANQRRAAELLFGARGLRLSAYRYNIGGGGVGVAPGDRAPQTPLVSPGVYDWSRDPGGTRFLQYADRYGVRDIVGFVNSAPAVWKDNGKSCGGRLRAGAEAAYAAYLTDVITHFSRRGVDISYLSPMNEPTNSFDGSPCTQEGMLVDVDRRDDIVRALGRELATRAPGTRISADESTSAFHFLFEVAPWLSQPDTAQYVANLAHHTYDYPPDSWLAGVAAVGRYFGKPTWATEICCFTGIDEAGGQQYDPTITSALAMSSIIHRDLTVADSSAFHWWTALSKVMGCSPGADPACAARLNDRGYNDGLVYFDPDYATNGNQRLYLTKRYHAMAQYSRYVRPGAVRHPVTGAPPGVQVLATRAGRTWTLVVNNLGAGAQAVDVRFGTGRRLTATAAYRTSASEDVARVTRPRVEGDRAALVLPAQSITTYVLQERGGSGAGQPGDGAAGQEEGADTERRRVGVQGSG